MNKHNADAWQDEFADDEFSEEEFADSDDVDTMDCPHCHQAVYDEAYRCPNCGHYLSDADRQSSRKSWWIVITVIACLCMIAYWILGPAL